jgi:DNA-directed RNA polymerase subunit D
MVVLTLDAKADQTPIQILSSSLVSDDPEVTPVSSKIPLTYLPPNGKLRLEAYAVMGKGKDHAKWQPVSTIGFKFQPTITIDTAKCKKDCSECVNACPRGVLKFDGKIVVVDADECSLCELCTEVCKTEAAAIEVGYSEEAFVFRIETTGALPTKEILTQGLEILKDKFKSLEKELMS